MSATQKIFAVLLSGMAAGQVAAAPAISAPAADQPLTESTPSTANTETGTTSVVPVAQKAESEVSRSALAAPASRLIEEVLVTAQKREENLQDVPIAISAYGSEQLDALGVENIKDLSGLVPSLQITDFAGYSMIYIRGIGVNSFFPSADPSVATYIDGVYFPSAHTLGEAFGKVQRVEVLKGPQGTLFGRNATGGAINVVTGVPEFTESFSATAGYSRFNNYESRASANMPLSDMVAVSAAAVYNKGDSYYKRVDRRDELRVDINRAARVQLRIAPTEDIDLVLTGMRQNGSGASSVVSVNTRPSVIGKAVLIQPEERNYVTANDENPRVHNETAAYYGVLTWKMPWFDVKLLGSDYSVKTTEFTLDFDGSPLPLVTSQGMFEFQENNSAELQFVSNPTSWAADWLQWTAGFYYYRSSGGYDPVRLSVARTVVALPTGEIVKLVPQGVLDLLPIPTQENLGALIEGTVGVDSYSGYAQATAALTDWLSLTLGGRYQQETRTLDKATVGLGDSSGETTLTLLSYHAPDDKRNNFSPKATIEIRAIDDVLLYGSYQKGYKSATFNVVNVIKAPNLVKPEIVTAYELGAKTKLFDGNVRLNGAIFQSTIEDLQEAFVSLLDGGITSFQNVGEARIRGAEADALWVLMPEINPGLVLTASATVLDAKYTDFKDGKGYTNSGVFTRGNDFTGNRIVRTPEFAGNLGLSQTIDTAAGPFEFGVDLTHNSGLYFLASNEISAYEPAYTLYNARVSYLYEPWNVRIRAFGANLSNVKYNISQFQTDFGRLDTLAPPRTYGMNVSIDF